MDLPPGFRFHPTDEEIVIHYLAKKVSDRRFRSIAIGEADLNKCEPWDLTDKKEKREREWFFFKKDRKYPTGNRTNRATESGYWKATGKDKEIFKGKSCLIGMKKTLVFYTGRAPKGEKTNWVMHEYRLEGNSCNPNIPKTPKEDWVVCRIFHKSSGVLIRSTPAEPHFLDSRPILPPLVEVPDKPSSSFNPKAIPEPNPNLYHQIAIPNSTFRGQDVPPFLDSKGSILGYHTTLPLRDSDQSGVRINAVQYQGIPDPGRTAYKMENQGMPDPGRTTYKMEKWSPIDSIISVSQDTAQLGTVPKGETEREKPFDDFEGIPFSPTISDLDYLWSN